MGSVDIYLLLIAIAGGVIIALLAFYLKSTSQHSSSSTKNWHKGEKTKKVRKAQRSLAVQNNDPRSLHIVAQDHYDSKRWPEAVEAYEKLLEISKKKPNVFSFDIPYRLGVSALNAKMYNKAIESLLVARSVKENSFDVNFALGKAEYLRKNYSAAANYFRWALSHTLHHIEAERLLGICLAQIGRFSEAMPLLEQILNVRPSDVSVIFQYAKACQFMNMKAKAMEYYHKLESNLIYGPYAFLQQGIDRMALSKYKTAISYFEKALAFSQIPQEVYLDLCYHLAESQAKIGMYKQSTRNLENIMKVNPTYKDVAQKLELYANEHLHCYLMGSEQEFNLLANRIAESFFLIAKVEVENIQYKKERNINYVDFTYHVTQPGRTEIILFRFMRSRVIIDDSVIRDLNSTMNEHDASQSFCVSSTGFSDFAKEYIRSRTIKLVGHQKLMNIFSHF